MLRIVIVLFISVIAFSCKKEKPTSIGGRATGPLTVDGFIVEEATIHDKVEVPGTLLPFEETHLRAEVSGRIVQLNIKEGAVSEKGDLLVKLFDEDLKAQLKKLNVQLQIASKNKERQKELLAINGVSQQDYDLSSLEVDNLKADIEAIRIAIAKTEIRAPYSGTIGLRYVSEGAYISPADVVATIRQTDKLKIDFSIPEKYAKYIRKDHPVLCITDGGTQTHPATVLATESGVDQTTRTLRIKAIVTETHPELVPGIFVKVIFKTEEDNKTLLVPTQAVIPQARNKQVIVLRKDSAQFVVVETGIRDSAFVQITQGLKIGDTVVTTGLMAVRPNAKIKVGKVAQYKSNK